MHSERTDDRSTSGRAPHGPVSRRHVLTGAGVALGGALAGCGSVLGGDGSDNEFQRLDSVSVYLRDDRSLSVPDSIQTVGKTHNADLLVLPGDTDTGVEQVVTWLSDGRAIALLGSSARSTWLTWTKRDAFHDAFSVEGADGGDPDPDLLVAAAVETTVSTVSHTWADGSTDVVLQALDESLVAIEKRRETAK